MIGFVPYCGIFKLFLKPDSTKQAYRFKDFLEKTGPCFVKLGQIFSVRSDLIGKTFATALAALREEGQKTDDKLIKTSIREAFGGEQLNLQSFFNNDVYPAKNSRCTGFENVCMDIFEPQRFNLIAVGSVAEVFKLTINENHALAIKVLKPKIHKQFQEDIQFLRKIFGFAQKSFKYINQAKIIKIVDLLDRISYFELDLKFEAASAAEMKDHFTDLPALLYVPKVYWRYCTKNVLVTEWIDGCKLHHVDRLYSQISDPKTVLEALIKVFFLQIFKFGFFHGDIHPGNIIVKPNGTLAMVDYGIMGRVSLVNRKYIYEVWKAFLNQDYKHAAQIHFDAGWVSKEYSIEDMALAIRTIVDPIFVLNDKTFAVSNLLEQLFEVTRAFHMEVQRDLLLIQKDMLILEGIARIISPETNVWRLAKEIINQKDFKVTSEDKIEYAKYFVNKKIHDKLYSVAKTFAVAWGDYKNTYHLMPQHQVTYKVPKGYGLILIFLSTIIIILLWKILS